MPQIFLNDRWTQFVRAINVGDAKPGKGPRRDIGALCLPFPSINPRLLHLLGRSAYTSIPHHAYAPSVLLSPPR